ncbi:bifunctional diguanylate cyclase/phosphodiesterase [Uliginosibacterium gangwonense]|uniref:bifunctional diguanylate cyclase/phosphodiesterase n=1 Tax=Uliginosibacterium gangwonense TaxID=392736 RepID=UPI00039E5F71|nr:EAL domain-containing protein [Uliginosibacterium gangwonense]
MRQGTADSNATMQWLMLMLAVLVSGCLVAVDLYQNHRRVDEQENVRLMTQGRVVRQNVLRQLESTNHMLRLLQVESGGDAPYLTKLAQGVPGIDALMVLDAKGSIFMANRSSMVGQDMSQSAIVDAMHQGPPQPKLYVALPRPDAKGSRQMQFARILLAPNGEYAGAVVANVNVDYFSTLLESINYAPDMWGAILHSDGRVFLTTPERRPETARQDLAALADYFKDFKPLGRAEEIQSRRNQFGRDTYRMAMLTVDADFFAPNTLLYIGISRQNSAIYAPWMRELKILLAGYGLIVALLVAGFWWYLWRQSHQQRLLARTERQLQSSASLLQLAAKAMGLGQWEFYPQIRKNIWDANMFAIYDVDDPNPSDFHTYWTERVLLEDIERVYQELDEALAGLRPYDVQFRLRRRDGVIRTVRSWGHVFRDADGAVERIVGLDEDITERVLAEERLVQREHDLQSILDNLPSLVGYWDSDLRNRFGNRTYGEWFHVDASVMPGMHLSELLGEENFQRNLPRALAALRGEAQLFNQVIPPDDGQGARHTLVHYIPDVQEGQVNGFYAMVSDVTVAKISEDALRESELRYRTLAQVAPVGIFCLDENADCIYVNGHWLDICGMAAEHAFGRVWLDSIYGKDRLRVESEWQMAMQSNASYTGEFRYLRADGQIVWVLARIAAELLPNGLLKGYVGTLTDITAIKKAEDELRLAANVFSYTQDGIVVTNDQNLIIDVNPAFSKITGYSREEALGRDPRFLGSKRQSKEFYTRMWHNLMTDGYWRGEIWNRRKSGEDYAELISIAVVRGSGGGLKYYVAVFSDITRYKNYEAELSRLAHFDPLTSLPNRRMLTDRLSLAIARARRTGQSLAVCYLDLDGFKPVNDRFGHDAGDRLLLEVSRRLQEALRADDTVARLGGDEFVLLLNGVAQVEECRVALQRILTAVGLSRLEDVPLGISASIGVTLFPEDDVDADTLLRHADQAMYTAKEEGRNRYHMFDPRYDKQARAQREAIERLSEAKNAGEFMLYYQPKVNLVSGEVIGAEALIRWRHPERGIVPPGEFLPLLEGTDLEISVGEWVIEHALQQIEAWKSKGVNLSVSANISPEHLRHEGFIDYLREALARHTNVLPGDLELEILESAAIGDIEQASGVLAAGVAMGVRFSLDDFGTGYSSLTYFRRLPISVLKIDQTFVRDMLEDPDDLGIVDSVVRLAEAFDRPAIAEGVETPQHGAMLVLLGCQLAQGYGIARPMPPEQMADWMAEWARNGAWRAMSSSAARHADVTLLVAVHGERVWFDGVVECLREGGGVNVPSLVASAGRFRRWRQGSAHRRYGMMPEFLHMGVCYEAVHTLASELLTLAGTADGPAACDRLIELIGLQEEFMASVESFTAQLRLGQA